MCSYVKNITRQIGLYVILPLLFTKILCNSFATLLIFSINYPQLKKII